MQEYHTNESSQQHKVACRREPELSDEYFLANKEDNCQLEGEDIQACPEVRCLLSRSYLVCFYVLFEVGCISNCIEVISQVKVIWDHTLHAKDRYLLQ
jgi:hypothetical protein